MPLPDGSHALSYRDELTVGVYYVVSDDPTDRVAAIAPILVNADADGNPVDYDPADAGWPGHHLLAKGDAIAQGYTYPGSGE